MLIVKLSSGGLSITNSKSFFSLSNLFASTSSESDTSNFGMSQFEKSFLTVGISKRILTRVVRTLEMQERKVKKLIILLYRLQDLESWLKSQPNFTHQSIDIQFGEIAYKFTINDHPFEVYIKRCGRIFFRMRVTRSFYKLRGYILHALEQPHKNRERMPSDTPGYFYCL